MVDQSNDDVVITGLGVVTPIGSDQETFWDSLCTGRNAAAEVTNLDVTHLTRRIACQVRDPAEGDSTVGRASQLAIAAARQAVADANLDCTAIDPSRLAVIAGTTMGETEFIEERLGAPREEWLNGEHLSRIAQGKPGGIARNMRQAIASEGWSQDLYGACAAGNMALAAAHKHLAGGRFDVVVAGGADGFSRLAFIGFMRLRVMAAELCRPFDEKRDGLLVGEGAGFFVMERESHARARGARIRARVAGCGVTSEDYHPTRPSPDGDGLYRAIGSALGEAGLSAEDVDYVCAHGTGTPQNDAIEVQVMQKWFPRGAPFSSIKALTGHTMGATAAIEAACCVLSLERQTLAPTWNLESPMPAGEMEPLMRETRPARVRCALNNSAGFGGYNSSVVLTCA